MLSLLNYAVDKAKPFTFQGSISNPLGMYKVTGCHFEEKPILGKVLNLRS